MADENPPAPSPSELPGDPALLAWFCLRSQPKHEHIAAANLRRLDAMDVFSPRIRFKRSTRRGPVWFTESLFPNYLFARFDWNTNLRRVLHVGGVASVVHFGSRWPTIPDDVIRSLRESVGTEELTVLDQTLQAGDDVEISGGAFHGLQGVITRVMPARSRVAVLLDFLGRQASIEVPWDQVVKSHIATQSGEKVRSQ
jgi:transcriptional antiterminator RfaH